MVDHFLGLGTGLGCGNKAKSLARNKFQLELKYFKNIKIHRLNRSVSVSGNNCAVNISMISRIIIF